MQWLATSENLRLTRKTSAARAMASYGGSKLQKHHAEARTLRKIFFVQECNAYDRVAQKSIERLP